MQQQVRFKTAPLFNKCDHFGWQLKKIAKSTKSSTTISISRFCLKSGLNALECFGTSQNQDLRKFTFEPPSVGAQGLRPYHVSRLCVSPENQENNSQRAIALLVNRSDGSVISRKALPFTMGRELSNSLVLTKRQITTTGSVPTIQAPGSVIKIGGVEWYV